MSNQEKDRFKPDINKDLEALREAGHEVQERLQESRAEKAREQSHENLQDARLEVEKATQHERVGETNKKERLVPPAERQGERISKAKEEASFKLAMNEIQSQMTAPSRTFSKLIHNKAVERLSEATGNTVARPDAILSGAIFAFVLTLGVYLMAKNLGYPLSGFETIGAFILGWIIGLVYDFLKVMITGRK